MANLNKVMLIGRLTRDPEVRTFSNGGKVAKIGFAVNNRKKNAQTGQWEDVPVFVDIDAFNREPGRKLADLVEQYMRKGQQFYIEGRLQLDQWTNQEGQKQSKLKVLMEDFQFLEPRADGGTAEGGARAPRAASPGLSGARRPAGPPANEFEEPEPLEPQGSRGGEEGEIPF
jgi:single-strand DNA-binding protein